MSNNSSIENLLPKSTAMDCFLSEDGISEYTIFYPQFGFLDNSITKPVTVLFLSRMLYWHGKGRYRNVTNGYVRKTNKELAKETLCSVNQIIKVVKKLVDKKLIDKKLGYANHPEYRVFWHKIDELMMAHQSGELQIDIKEPTTVAHRTYVTLRLKGLTAFEAYSKAYSTKGKNKSQIQSKANQIEKKYKPFILAAKSNPTAYVPKLNGTYKKASSKAKGIPVQLEMKVPTPKAKTTSRKTNARKLNQLTDTYLDAFKKKYELYFKGTIDYERPVYDKKHRTQIRNLVKWLQERILQSSEYKKAVEIPLNVELKKLKGFLDIAATCNNGFFKKMYTPAGLNSQKQNILVAAMADSQKTKVRNNIQGSTDLTNNANDVYSKLTLA